MTARTFHAAVALPVAGSVEEMYAQAAAPLAVLAAICKRTTSGPWQYQINATDDPAVVIVVGSVLAKRIGDRRASRAPHGTDGGFTRHRRLAGDQPCGPCRAAHAAEERARARRAKGKAMAA